MYDQSIRKTLKKVILPFLDINYSFTLFRTSNSFYPQPLSSWSVMSSSLVGLPDYLLETFVKPYLNTSEWRLTMNTSVLFADKKKKTVYLTLNNTFSQKFCLEVNFRQRVLQVISDKQLQLSLDLHSTPMILSKHLYTVDGVHSLNLANNQQLVDVNMLPNVKILDLSGCHSIRDVSKLKKVHRLILPRCYELRSLQGLEHVSTLNISSCHLIDDVSMLQSIEILTVNNCPNITNIQPLQSVQECTFTHCQGIQSIPTLKNVKTLDVSYCKNLQEIEDLPIIERLTVNYCSQINKIGKMSNIREVSMIGCPTLPLQQTLLQLACSPLETITVCKCQGEALQASVRAHEEERINVDEEDKEEKEEDVVLKNMMKKMKMTATCLCH